MQLLQFSGNNVETPLKIKLSIQGILSPPNVTNFKLCNHQTTITFVSFPRSKCQGDILSKSFTRYEFRKCLLADRYGLPIRDHWQTVRSANKRLLADHSQNIANGLPKSYCWQTTGALHKRATITALFKRLWQSASALHLQAST